MDGKIGKNKGFGNREGGTGSRQDGKAVGHAGHQDRGYGFVWAGKGVDTSGKKTSGLGDTCNTLLAVERELSNAMGRSMAAPNNRMV